jgi:hypothetical protein
MLRTTSMWVTSDTSSPDNSTEARRALQLPSASYAGFLVRTASNGLEALIAAYEMRPRVIIMMSPCPCLMESKRRG